MGLDCLNGFPVVGYINVFSHALSGEHKEAIEAFKQANRTTTVMGSGAIGFLLGGPPGSIAASATAGYVCDTVDTLASGKSKGIIKGAEYVLNDLDNNKSPVASIAGTSLMVGADILTGYGGAKWARRYV